MNQNQNQQGLQNWTEHLEDRFGQQVPGERVPSMDVLEKVRTTDGHTLRLGCSSCGTEFWTNLARDGQNTVVRQAEDKQGDEIVAQCPACGSEWNGKRIRFFSIGVPESEGKRSRVDIFDSVAAQTPLNAMQIVLTKNMVPATISQDRSFHGLQIDEITVDEHRLLQIRKRVQDAVANNDPNLAAIIAKATFAESTLRHEITLRQQRGKSYRNERGPRERRLITNLDNLPTSDDLVAMIMGNRTVRQPQQQHDDVRTPSHVAQPAAAGKS